MTDDRTDKVELTTMVLIFNDLKDKVLLINKTKGNWLGYTPPGGHVDFNESIADCAIREVKEETGLDIFDLKYKGLAHWANADNSLRYMVFSYVAYGYKGMLESNSDEGIAEWISINDFDNIKFAPGCAERFPNIFFNEGINEMFTYLEKGKSDRKVIVN